MHRYAPTSPSAFNHKKKPLLPGCDRHPSRSLARGAQQQPSPPHSGRGHSTAYTHRHFPLPSLVQDCSDDPLALAQAQTPHMPQYVSLRLWLPDNAPSALVDVLAQTPTHISRPSPKTPYCAHCPTPLLGVRQLSHVLYCPAPAHGNSTTCAFPSAEVPAPQIPTAPVELCIPTHPKLQRGHRPNDGRNTRFQRARIALCSRIVPSTDQVVLLKIPLYFRYGNIFLGVTRFHNNIEDHDDIFLLSIPTAPLTCGSHNSDVLCAFRLPPTADFTTIQHSQR